MKKLFYDKPASDWNEALPIGNGFLGAMVFGQVNKERIQFNEDSLWSGGFIDRTNQDSLTYLNQIRKLLEDGNIKEAENLASQSMFGKHPHMRHYQTMGDIWIDFFNNSYSEEAIKDEAGLLRIVKHEKLAEDYRRELNLEQATVDVSYKLSGNQYERQAFASYPNNVVVYKLTSAQANQLNFKISMTRKDLRSGRGASYLDELEAFDNQFIKMKGHQGSVQNGIDFSMVLKVETTDGNVKQMGSQLVVENASEATIFVTGRTSFRNDRPFVWCMDNLEKAASKGYDKLLAEHIEDYQHYFHKVSLNFERDFELERLPINQRLDRMKKGEKDKGLIELYSDFGRYLLIESDSSDSNDSFNHLFIKMEDSCYGCCQCFAAVAEGWFPE